MAGNKRVMLLFVIVLSGVFEICLAKSIVVGGTTGWTIPTTPSFYSNWASTQKLHLGDVLVFTFPAGIHTVAEVSKANYDSCSTTNSLGPVMATAPANITLTKPGTHYFICTIAGHCGANQKLTVSVTASTPAPTPKPSPSSPKSSPIPSPKSSPTPTPSTSPASSPTPTPTPAPSVSSPAPTPVGSGPVTSAPTVPAAASGPAGGVDGAAAAPPAGNSAGSTSVTLLSFLSVVVMALVL